MAYKLTQADIDKYNLLDAQAGDIATPEEMRVIARNSLSERAAADAKEFNRILTPADIEMFQLTGAMPGEAANAADIAKMGVAPAFQLPPEAAAGVSIPQATLSPLRTITVGDNPAMPRADAQPIALDAMKALGVSDGREPTYSEARAAGMDPGDAAVASGQATQAGTTAPIVAAPQVAGMPAGPVPASLLQQPVDPLDQLTRSQRLMIAGAAIADAGAALQGRQGGAVQNLLGRFNEIADMNRKREAARQRNKFMAQLFGVGGAGGAMGGDVDLESRRQAVLAAGVAGVIEPAAMAAMLSEINRAELQSKADQAVVQGAGGALEDLKRLEDIATESGTTGFTGWLFSNLPWSKASAARNIADTLRSGMALGALKELKAGGATLGSVSAPELNLLESAIAKLDLNMPRDQVMSQLKVIEGHYKDAIRRGYSSANDQERQKFDQFFGGKTPDWIFGEPEGQGQGQSGPMDDLTPEQKKRLGI